MKDLYPEAVFPDVYIVIGRLTSGGTTSDRGLLIGAEMNGRTPGMPVEELNDWLKQVITPVDRIPHIIAHELIHFEQKYGGSEVLLVQSIRGQRRLPRGADLRPPHQPLACGGIRARLGRLGLGLEASSSARTPRARREFLGQCANGSGWR